MAPGFKLVINQDIDLWKMSQWRLPMNHLIVFIIGLVQDTISGYHLNLVGQKRNLLASLITGISVILSYLVFIGLWEQLSQGNYIGIVIYAIGCTIGHYAGLSIKAKDGTK